MKQTIRISRYFTLKRLCPDGVRDFFDGLLDGDSEGAGWDDTRDGDLVRLESLNILISSFPELTVSSYNDLYYRNPILGSLQESGGSFKTIKRKIKMFKSRRRQIWDHNII